MPPERERVDLWLLFSDAEGERIREGHIPLYMEDKWFIFFENGWLYFHRSWTGYCIYAVRLDCSPGGVRVVEAWANRDQQQYYSPGMKTDKHMVEQLMRSYLLS